MPIFLISFQLTWIEQASYTIRVQDAFTHPYQSTSEIPLYGTSQGTGWSPPNWSAISDIISRVMQKHVPGFRLTRPNQTMTKCIIDAFVDDVNSGLD